ncbi:hypothetical protein GCM10007147_24260 [Nocardiopsis kunsanensis]|uniref:Uncharacterized protein n=1 Tax=Nocardiopsis kunsanensis TaxID=141693 RepID=A0A918XCM8_9ACTN|nr:hypothetical protein GCM10007147_24260 [Nocardiopsis kunsanensis]
MSSYSPSEEFSNCQPPHDKISIIEVPTGAPASAEVVNEPVLFPDGGHEETIGCHDITAYPEKGIAVGACIGDGIIMDITDPDNPEEIGSFDRGPWDPDQLSMAGSWSAYYYNGHVYSSDIQHGLDVLRLTDERTLGPGH